MYLPTRRPKFQCPTSNALREDCRCYACEAMFHILALPVMNHALGASCAGRDPQTELDPSIPSAQSNFGPRKATKGWQAMSMLEAGQAAPDFSLPGDGESKIRIQDFRGRKVVLYFYPKDDTSGCTQEAKEFSALKGDFA